MVFFACNACGVSLKKNKVEAHLMHCRSQSVSCIDCSKDFPGHTYNQHNTCISEDQKYGGLNYQPKENANKGQKKQDQWLENLRGATDKATGPMRKHLERLAEYPNIPRKKPKFFNFLQSSMRIFDPTIHEHLWHIVDSANKQASVQAKNAGTVQGTKRPLESDEKTNGETPNTDIKKPKSEENIDAKSQDNSDQAIVNFKWSKAVKKILKNNDGVLSLKKLRKQLKESYLEKTERELTKDVFNDAIAKLGSKFEISEKQLKYVNGSEQ
ncbi:hypothetical protein HDE_02444 [Halotydeus destructor]|nr:hypothetical protein HDE_02444 [Halotydeus destructor]